MLRLFKVARLSVKVVLKCSWTDFAVRLGQLHTGDSLIRVYIHTSNRNTW